jgi:hypothetical protein
MKKHHRLTSKTARKRATAAATRKHLGGCSRVVYFPGGRCACFHKPGTSKFRKGRSKKVAQGKKLARKYGFFRKAGAVWQRRPNKKPKLIMRLR